MFGECSGTLASCPNPPLHDADFALLVHQHKDAWEEAKTSITEAIRIAKETGKKRKREAKESNANHAVHVLPVSELFIELGVIGTSPNS